MPATGHHPVRPIGQCPPSGSPAETGLTEDTVYLLRSSDCYLPDRAAAAVWVRELRDRLRQYLRGRSQGQQD
ncbi:hypothetical protein AVL62_05955 [Serinicoccus chungangensis]|uniref:Uncharacterized protein n=1 Tax=Serinicoccus chungangensis TaxID=767452 RepID=A0A0W8IHA0_9MICO|nr:hypothetical protein AVL62_05955 [Serinicoccus chungangensis]